MQGERRGKRKLVFLSSSEPQPTLGEAKVVQGEWNAKEKRSFSFHCRAAAWLRAKTRKQGGSSQSAPVAAARNRCFLTRRIEYFRALAPLLANTRKTERLGFQIHPCEAPPQGRPKTRFLPLYGTNRGCFSIEKWPWIGNSIPWIGRSMGWKQKSMGWIGRSAAWTDEKFAGRRAEARVRFNAVPYSAQGLRSRRRPVAPA